MKKFLMISLLIFAAFLFVSCVDEEDFESALAGSACETLDTFKCDGSILLKCEEYVWEKIKLCSDTQKCDAVKGRCETTDGSESDNESSEDNSGSHGGNQNDPTDPGYNQDPTNPTDPTDPGYTDPTNDPTNDPTTDPTTDPTNDPTTPDPQQCTGLSVDWDSLTTDDKAPGVYYYTDGNPYVSFEFVYDDNSTVKKGTYNLGSGLNTNYKTCTECVRLIRDHEDFFFQTSGTLKIDSVDSSNNIKGTLSAKFIEVTIAPEPDYTSTPVPGGECFEIQSGSFDNTTGGGDNPGGNDDPATGCTEITLKSDISFKIIEGTTIPAYYMSYDPNTGSSTSDSFGIELNLNDLSDVNGPYDLSDTNYGDPDLLDIIVYEDNGAKYFFQREGNVVISNYNNSTHNIKVQFSGVILEEVTIPGIDNENYTSYPVTNGRCLKVKNTTVSYSE